MTVEEVESWPERLKQVTVENIRDVARKYLVDKNSVTGILVPAPDKKISGEQPAHAPSPGRS
jgi:zinc protease